MYILLDGSYSEHELASLRNLAAALFRLEKTAALRKLPNRYCKL
ncbi:hypothetical protein [Nitrosomonas sp. HPC101]|nr:hypothetical protein [Nitrosomonas sp. HPC101]